MTKTTYVGLDVHAATITIALLEEHQEKPEIREIPNNPAAIRKAFKQIAKDRSLRCCYEAGPCGYVLQRQLAAMGIECQVVAPSLIPQKPGDRVKTDRRDAAKLARLLRSGDLTPSWCRRKTRRRCATSCVHERLRAELGPMPGTG